ncbi:MAG: hypothetical protein V3U02_06875 [Calditrichia bacterium]
MYEIKKAKIEHGAFFDGNKFLRNILIFVSILAILIVGSILVFGNSLANSLLNDNDMSSSMDFDTDVDLKFDGYFTQRVTREVAQLDPDCRDSFDYFKYSYKNKTWGVIESLERINDDGWIQYYEKCIGDKEFPEHDYFVAQFREAVNRSDIPVYDKNYLEHALKDRVGVPTTCNTTLILYKKNLKDCEREIIEVETPRMFIPTNLTVNGISISGNGSGDIGNLVGVEMFSILADLHWSNTDLRTLLGGD